MGLIKSTPFKILDEMCFLLSLAITVASVTKLLHMWGDLWHLWVIKFLESFLAVDVFIGLKYHKGSTSYWMTKTNIRLHKKHIEKL